MSKAIQTKWHGMTNTQQPRIIASDLDGNRLVISIRSIPKEVWDQGDQAPHEYVAYAFVKKMGWKGNLVGGGIDGGYAFCFDDWLPRYRAALIALVEIVTTNTPIRDPWKDTQVMNAMLLLTGKNSCQDIPKE